MTARELINNIQSLGEKNLDREVVMFDGPAYYTPSKVEILDSTWKSFEGYILID
jgi:hypothetical protein